MDLTLYRTMLTIRLLEDELQKLCNLGEAGDLHFNKGQEAIAVGACAALLPTDYIVVHHRTIAHALARGVPMLPLVAEILGRSTGICGGRAGEMHISYPPARFLFSFQLVGTSVSVASGLAWAVKRVRKSSDIVAVFHGDAATANAQWHEGLNIAAVLKVPLLLICENNGLAGNVRSPYYLPVGTVAERAAGYGIEATTIDGNQVVDVCDAVREASGYVRGESRPFLLECLTTRTGKHKQGMGDVRTKEELEELAKRDPLLLEERRLGLSEEARGQLRGSIGQTIAAVIDRARQDSFPSLADLKERYGG